MQHNIRIEITNYCNKKCAYCFFKDLLSDKKEELSLSELNTILDYCEKENFYSVALQGGEPTTHTQIDKILNILTSRKFRFIIFTNGIFDTRLLKNKDFAKAQYYLVNYNHPDTYDNIKEWDLVDKNIKQMIDKKMDVDLGYNLYEKNPDYVFY